MKLVEATEDDLAELADRWYALATAMEAYDDLNELASDQRADISIDGFRTHLTDEAITDYRIVHETETIGFVTLREGYHPSREYSHYLRIVNLALDDGYRNRGHGSAVVERVTEMARNRDCDLLTVSCEWANEDARRFYTNAGFREKQVDFARPLD
ncbi:GNAT family N-acetyltransferase [Halocatena halophila]|uniref:GNAT family N-acetyltransferase n=1 Tax=Halocatena halophila TaxID=2814576 RepID=UPI002ED654D9